MAALKNKFNIPSPDEVNSFVRSAGRGKRDEVQALLDKFGPTMIDREAVFSDTALTQAARTGQTGMVEFLLDCGADIHKKGGINNSWPALVCAAWCKHYETAALLLDRGASVDGYDSRSWTPLMRAAYAGDERIVALLLEKGADISPVNDIGKTALQLAESNGSSNAAALLNQWPEILRQREAALADINASLKRDTPVSKPLQLRRANP